MGEHQTVTYLADNKSGLTLGDLWSFCQSAYAADIDPRTPVQVRVGWKFNALSIEATSSRTPDRNRVQ